MVEKLSLKAQKASPERTAKHRGEKKFSFRNIFNLKGNGKHVASREIASLKTTPKLPEKQENVIINHKWSDHLGYKPSPKAEKSRRKLALRGTGAVLTLGLLAGGTASGVRNEEREAPLKAGDSISLSIRQDAGQASVRETVPADHEAGHKDSPNSVDEIDRKERIKAGEKYIVKAGDNLWNIAAEKYKDPFRWHDISDANRLENPSLIFPDQSLVIPKLDRHAVPEAKGEKYIVKKGDNLWNIAKERYGDPFKWHEIADANQMNNPRLIFPDQKLVMPVIEGQKMLSGELKPGKSVKQPEQPMAEKSKSGGKVVYSVRAGDNLSTIAAKYNTTVEAILKENPGRISNIHVIHPGEKYNLVPGKKVSSPPRKQVVPVVQPAENRASYEPGDLSPKAVREKAKLMTIQRYGTEAWPAIDFIISHESGYRYNAINPNGGATGLPQALPGEKLLREIGSLENVSGQINWLFKYVDQRYGGPWGAYNFWINNHWY